MVYSQAVRVAAQTFIVTLLIGCGRVCGEDAPLNDVPLQKPPSVRTVCPNYAKVLADSSYPRDAVARNLDSGEAVIDFVVYGGRAGKITVFSESDPAFGAAAIAAIAKFECLPLEQPIHFRLPFKFKRT